MCSLFLTFGNSSLNIRAGKELDTKHIESFFLSTKVLFESEDPEQKRQLTVSHALREFCGWIKTAGRGLTAANIH